MARTFPEYPFLPNQPGIKSEAFGQLSQPHLHDPMEGPARTPPFPLGNEQLPRIHATQSHSSRVRHLSQQDRHVIPYSSPPRDNDVPPRRKSYTNIADAALNFHFTDHPIVGQDNPHFLPAGQVSHNDTVLRMEKKRKVLI